MAAGEEKAVRESVSGLKASLEEALARERRLAAHKHNLELALTDAQQVCSPTQFVRLSILLAILILKSFMIVPFENG